MFENKCKYFKNMLTFSNYGCKLKSRITFVIGRRINNNERNT